MSGQDPKSNGSAVVPVAPAPVGIRQEIVEAYAAMFETIPDAGGEGMEQILETISLADNAAELDAPWRSTGLEAYDGAELEFRAIRKSPSDYPGGLPFFLVCDAIDLRSGELVTITTGAVSVVAQLVKAWSLGSLPLKARVVTADRPTKSGYYPQHLQVLP